MQIETAEDCPRQGPPCDIWTKRLVQTVMAHILWYPLRKQSVMARELNKSKVSMFRVLRSDLGLKGYQQSTGHFLTLCLKEQRVIKSVCLLQHYTIDNQRRILFIDEKIFNIKKALWIQRGHHPASAMVWWGVVYDGITKSHFCEKVVKTTVRVYENTMMESVASLWTTIVQKWTLQLGWIQHPPSRQTLLRTGPGGMCWTSLLWVIGLLAALTSIHWTICEQCLRACSVRRDSSISTAWSAR